jgi:hypothetical protein
MLVYHLTERAYHLAAHSIRPLSPAKQSKFALWSCWAWVASIVLQLVRLKEDWKLMKRRMRALERSFASGTVETTGSEAEKLREVVGKRKDTIWNDFVVNIGYLPLTVHW